MKDEKLSLCFGGCSWGCVYYIGVYKYLKSVYSRKQLQNFRISGTSSGIFIAVPILLGKEVDELVKMYKEFADIARKYGVMGKMSIYHEYCFTKWLPDGGNEYKVLNDRLFILVSRPFSKYEIISHWNSNTELKQTIHAT